jgi:hypothetical protein
MCKMCKPDRQIGFLYELKMLHTGKPLLVFVCAAAGSRAPAPAFLQQEGFVLKKEPCTVYLVIR